MLGRLQVPLTLLAPQDCDLLLEALCDVYLGSYAVHAHVRGVGWDGHATEATQPAGTEAHTSFDNLLTSQRIQSDARVW